MHVKASHLTPGLLDGSALHAFKVGACGALAIAMHEELGWPIYAVTDAHNVEDGVAGGGSALHWVVKRPDGLFVDVDGAHTAEELVSEYEGEADGGQCAIGQSSRADCWEWYGEAQGEPIPVSLAKKFVDVVVTKAAASEPEQEGKIPHQVANVMASAKRHGQSGEGAKLPYPIATGEWSHNFGVGSIITRCRIAINMEQATLIVAQEWTGLKFEDVTGDRLESLTDSVIDAAEAHANPDAFGLYVGRFMPAWVYSSSQEQVPEHESDVPHG